MSSSPPVPPLLPAVMRPPAEVASAPAGGSREQEQGEAQGGSEVLVSGRVRVRVIRRVANGKWEDEESLASSPLAVHCGHSPHFCGARRPADGLSRRRASHFKRGSAVWGRSPHFNNPTFLGPAHGLWAQVWSSLMVNHEKFSASMSNTTMTSSGRLVRASTACTWRLSDRARCARMTTWNRNCP